MSHLRTAFFASITSLAILAVTSSTFAQVQPEPMPVPTPAEVVPTPTDPANPPTPIPAINPKPIIPVIPTSAVPVAPAPPVNPAAIPTLIYGRLFVIQSQVKFKLFVSDSKLVNIRKVKGPRDISGVFADGDGSDEDRTYDAPFLAIIKAEKNQTGQVKLIYDPSGAEDESEATEILLLIGPRPPPEPDPQPDPEPDPIPDPQPVPTPPTGFRVIFIYKSTANLTREQYNILYSTKIVEYLNSHCVKADVKTPEGIKQQPEWRKWRPGQEIAASESKTIVDLWNSIDKDKISDKLPQLAIAVNGHVNCTAITASDTEQSILAKLKAAGGE